MDKKIICIFVSMLMCATVVSVAGTKDISANNEIVKNAAETQLCGNLEDWIHYDDGTCENSLGLTSGGVAHEVIKLTPDELGGYDNYKFTNVKVMHGYPTNPGCPDMPYEVWIYTGTDHPAGDPLTEATIVASGNSGAVDDFVVIDIDDYVFNPDDTVWIGVAWTQPASTYPMGMDTDTVIEDKSGWIYSTATGWTTLVAVSFPGSWMLYVQVESANAPPNTPSAPSGTDSGVTNVDYKFTATTTDPEGENIYYMFDWGDSTYSDWIGPITSGNPPEGTHKWIAPGDYIVKVKAKDINGGESAWSPGHNINIIVGPILEVYTISGGLFKVKATIKNTGGAEATNVAWKIELIGGAILGKSSTGTIPSIIAGGAADIESKLIVGLGATTVKVTATCTDSTATDSSDGFIS